MPYLGSLLEQHFDLLAEFSNFCRLLGCLCGLGGGLARLNACSALAVCREGGLQATVDTRWCKLHTLKAVSAFRSAAKAAVTGCLDAGYVLAVAEHMEGCSALPDTAMASMQHKTGPRSGCARRSVLQHRSTSCHDICRCDNDPPGRGCVHLHCMQMFRGSEAASAEGS